MIQGSRRDPFSSADLAELEAKLAELEASKVKLEAL